MGMDKQTISNEEMLAVLNNAVAQAGSLRAFAKAHGVSPQFAGDVIAGRRNISERIACAFGYEKSCVWRKKDANDTTA